MNKKLLQQALDVLLSSGAKTGYATEQAWDKVVADIQAELAKPEHEDDEVQKDAARFRWMQSKMSEIRTKEFGAKLRITLEKDMCLALEHEAHLRKVIDTAMGVPAP
jgi:L-ascorbate metabolism protein UlaG (beta-lactamase superfamily)